MNERIKELAEQATKHYPATDSSGEFSIFDKEKFAELIVKECLNKIEQAGAYFNTQPQYTDKQNKLVDEGFTWGVESCQAIVKQHFGVEESEQSAADRILSTIRKRS